MDMNNKGIIALFVLIFITGYLGYGQQNDNTYQFSLEQAKAFALQNNLEQKNAELDIYAAQKRVWETTAIGLPQISGSVNYQHIPGEIPTVDIGGGIGETFGAIFEALIELGYDPGKLPDMDEGETEPATIAQKNSTTYSVTVSQLVFSGEYIVGLQASRTFLQISQLSQEKKELDIKNNITSSYITINVLESNKAIIDSSIENVEKLLAETRAMAEQGFLESTDVDQMELTLNNLKNSASNIQRQIDVSYILLKIQMGLDKNATITLTEDLEQVQSDIMPPDNGLPAYNVENTVTYRILENQVEASELSLKREKSTYLPSISAFYQYSDKTNKATFDFTINHVIGVNVSVPIFSSFQRNARVEQAKVELEKVKNNRELSIDNLQMQAQQARFNYLSAKEKYQNALRNAELSETILERTTVKYKEGMTSSLELTQANNQFLDAQSSENQALMELLNAKVAYDKLLNQL